MATFNLPVPPRHTLVFHIALSMAIFYLGNALPDIPVHVTVARPKRGDSSLPDQLSLAIQDDSGWQTDLVLTRAKYIEPDIPVYTYCGGHKSGSDYQLADLEDRQDTAYYQSAEHKAAFQVTKQDSSDFLLDGDLVVNGTRFSLTLETKSERDAASSSPISSRDARYILQELPPVEEIDYGFIDLASRKRELQPQISEVSGASDTKFESVRQNDGQNIYIDVVAVVDYAKYQQFEADHGSKSETLQAMREYYLYSINDVNTMYKSATDIPYTIHVRLVAIYADEDSSAPWTTDNFLVGDGRLIDGDAAYSNFVAFAQTDAADVFYPNDHIMFFSGYDVVTFRYGYLSQVWGMASYNTVCNRGSASLNEDNNKYQAATTSTHELGHALSARHDGEGNSCTTGVMSLNFQLIFSKCSANYFNEYITKLLTTPEGEKCLLEQLPSRNVRSSFSRDLSDQEISFDSQ